MKPVSLTLKGFTGIRSGLGRDEITINLAAAAGDGKLIALIGPNGAGKSTILDNLQPYRVMASRASSYSPGAFSYYDHIYGPEAMKELVWEYAGKTYRSTLIFKQTAKTKKQEAYIHELSGNSWIPASIPDGTVSDGKTVTYDAVLDGVLGTPMMFFTAAFSAQGRKQISGYSNGDIKGLLSELLGLDAVTEKGVKAAMVGKLLRGRLEAMRGDLSRIAAQEADRELTRDVTAAAKADLLLWDQAKRAARDAVRTTAATLADLQSEQRILLEADARRSELTAQLVGAERRIADAKRQTAVDIAAEERRRTETQAAAKRESDRLLAQASTLDAQVEANRALLERRDEVRAAAASTEALAAVEAAAAADLDQARTDAENFRRLEVERAGVDAALAGITREGKQLTDHCAALKARACLADEVPCHGTDLQGRCKLLADTLAARFGIPEAELKAAAKREDYRNTKLRATTLAEQVQTMGDPRAALAAAERALADAQRAARQNAEVAALATAIDQAEAHIRQAEAQIQQIREDIAARGTAVATSEVESAERIADLQERIRTTEESAAREIAAIRHALGALPPPAAMDALEAARKAAEDAEAKLTQADQQVAALNARIAALQERIRGLDKALAEAEASKTTAARLEDEIAQWSLLAKALSNDGIVALAIDDAGPTLSSLANDLLLACFGPRFTVRIDTQAETAKGDLKESFDIVVFDSERDDEKSARDMSGGERVYINEALTRAMALYQAQASGRHYECLFADESDGALDPARKQQFVEMKRKALELSGCRSEIFISHTPELWEMADARIDLTNYKMQ